MSNIYMVYINKILFILIFLTRRKFPVSIYYGVEEQRVALLYNFFK